MNSALQFINNNITPNNQKLALSALEELLQFKESDDLYYSCGLISANLNEFNNSLYYFNKALELNPYHKQSLFDLGAISSHLGNWDNSIMYGDRLIDLDPSYNNILIHVANTYSYVGNHNISIEYFKKAIDINPYNLTAWSDLFLSLNYVDINIEDRISLRNKFSSLFSSLIKNESPQLQKRNKYKVAYISSDFRNHAVSYFLKGLITKHNKEKFDIYFYSCSNIEDDITEQFKNSGNFINCYNMSTEDVVQRIKNDEIDILIDLNGFTQSNRLELFLYNCAPIQVSWLGFLNSLGIPSIKYKISDENLIDNETEGYYYENIIKLKNSLIYDPPSIYPEITPLPYTKNQFITFGYFNNLRKLNVNVLDTWVEIFKNNPNCKLIIIKSSFDKLNQNLVSYFNSKDFFNIELRDESTLYDLMHNISEVDIALDPFPHSGGATTAHCLWMGVPVLTIDGKIEFERISSSISKSLGLDIFIAKDKDQYMKKGIHLDMNELENIRCNLRSRFPKAESVIHELESNFEKMLTKNFIT